MGTPAIDWGAAAKQYGGTAEQPADPKVDWASAAKQYGGTVETVDKGPAERFYEKTPVKPVVDTLTADLEGKTGAEFAKQLAVNYGKSLTLLPAQTIANMGKSIWDGVANDHQAAVEAANKGDYVGAIRHVVNGAERVGNPLNSSLIQDTRESVRKDVGEGNLAGAAGTLLPWVAGEVPGMVKAAPGALKAAPGAIARAAESTEAAVTGAAGGIANAAKAGELYPKGYSRFFPGVVAHQLGFPQVAALLEGGALAAPTLKAGMRGAKASLADLADARQLKSLVEEGQRAPAVSPDVMSQFFEPDEIAGSTPPPNSEARVSPVPASAPASPSPSEPTVNLNQLAEFSTSDLAAAVKRMADRRAASKAPPMAGGLPIEGPSPANVPITPGGQSAPLPVSPEVALPTRQGPGTLADLANPKSLIEEGLKARRNAQREAKVNKVLKTFTDAGFTSDLVDKMSDMQWKGVAQKAGVNDLSSSQIDMVKGKLKDTPGSITLGGLDHGPETVYRSAEKGKSATEFNKDGILYTTPDKEYAAHFGSHEASTLSASPQNTLDLRSLPHEGVTAKRFIRGLESNGVEISDQLSERLRDVEEDVGGEPLAYFANHGKALREAIQKAGFDSARINEYVEGYQPSHSLMIFDPKHVKRVK